MSSSNVQFSVAVHMMAILGYYDDPVKSSTLAKSVAAEPSFVARNYPSPYVYKPDMRLLQEDFPTADDVRRIFS